MRRAALLKRSLPDRLRTALSAFALFALVGCGPPSGGIPPSYVAESPLPAEQPSSAGSSSIVASEDAPLTDAAAGLLFIADFGGGDAQEEIAESMLAWKERGHRVDAVVTAGDNVYPKGQEAGFEPQVRRPYAPLEVPMIISLGNHDAQTAGGARLLDYFGMPRPPSSHRFGPVEVFVLDSNRVDASQARWLEEKLRASEAAVRVLVFHHPVFSCGPHGSTASVQQLWLPVIEARRPELVVNGHDHNYQRIIQEVGEDRIVYAITGGGGRDLTGPKAGCNLGPASPRRLESRHQFLSLEVRSDGRWVLRAVTGNATVFDFHEGGPNPGVRR